MQHHELEAWVLQIIDRVTAGQPIEDSRVELKAEWPDPKKAARQIAGHANTAYGAPILWLVGIDEKRHTVTGATETELANWYPQVQSQFDGLAPRVNDLNVPTKGGTVVALLFETDRAPFVVKNPEGGTIQFEVPWRENNATRTADRSDLIRLLSPLQVLPEIELLSARLTAHTPYPSASAPAHLRVQWSLSLSLYVVPHAGVMTVIPFHRCKAYFEIPGSINQTDFTNVSLEPVRIVSYQGSRNLSLTIDSTNSEVLIQGPGKALLSGIVKTAELTNYDAGSANISVSLLPTDAVSPIVINQQLKRLDRDTSQTQVLGEWRWSVLPSEDF